MKIERKGSRCIQIWEPLRTKAPGPHLTQPYCCYIRTVIFYVRGYILRPFSRFWRSKSGLHVTEPNSIYEEWDRIETDLTWDTPIEFEGRTYYCGGGRVVYRHKQWFMRRLAFLENEETAE